MGQITFLLNGAQSSLLQAAPLGILAGAQTILMLTGGIDPSVTMITTGSVFIVSNQSPQRAAPLVLGLLVGLIVGTVYGLPAWRTFESFPDHDFGYVTIPAGSFFTTWAQTVLQGSTLVHSFVKTLGAVSFLKNQVPFSEVVWILAGTGILWILKRTGWRRPLFAIGHIENAVQLAGVRVWRVRIAAFMVAGVLSSL